MRSTAYSVINDKNISNIEKIKLLLGFKEQAENHIIGFKRQTMIDKHNEYIEFVDEEVEKLRNL